MFRKTLLFLVLSAPFLLAGCKERYSWYQINTITIQTPSGPVSGTGTERVKLRISPNAVLSGPLGWTYWGEGAVVDLGDRRFVFALIYLSKHERSNIEGSFHPDVRVRIALKRLQLAPHLDYRDGKPWFKAMMSAAYPIELEGREIPTLVAFKDINDPSTIIELKSQADFDAVFGEGYGFLSAELRVTKSGNINQKVLYSLPWLKEKRGFFTLFGEACSDCTQKGQYVESPAFGDFIGRSAFVKAKP